MSKPQLRTCLISCSVLEKELKQLAKQRNLDVDLVFVSKYFHVEYELLERNLRRILEKTKQHHKGKIVLIYGDLCLGPNGEMKQLAEEYKIVKVDAVNCIDCMLGGKGKFLEADPEHDLFFLGPGMTEFFKHMKKKMLNKNMNVKDIRSMFNGLRGIIYLDTLGDGDKAKLDISALDMGLPILETRNIGLEPFKQLVCKTIAKANNSKD